MDAISDPVLITGGTGFLGANLVRHLAEHGYRVVAYDLQEPPPIVERYWRPVNKQITFEAGSVTLPDRLADVSRQHTPATIIHAAAVTAVNAKDEARLATHLIDVNLMGTLHVLNLARKRNVRRLIYISSGGVYAITDPTAAVSEDEQLRAHSLYTIAKNTSERICRRYSELFALNIVIGRLGQPYGPMERDTGVRSVLSPIYQMARIALLKGIVRLPKPDYSCDWTYTGDLGEAIRLLLETTPLQYHIYNLSSGRPYRLSQVSDKLRTLIPNASFQWVCEGANIDTSSDPRRGPMDISRLRQDVGFMPAYDLERGLEAALPWWREMVKEESVGRLKR